MTYISEEFASPWLRADDMDDVELTLTIASVGFQEFKLDKGGKQKKVVLQFREKVGGMEKGLVANVINRNTLVNLHGDDTDDWVGKRITLYTTEVAFEGKMVDSIRIRSKAPKAKAKALAETAVTPGEVEGDEDGIPF